MLTPKSREEFGKKVRKAREAKKLSPYVLATKLGHPNSVIGNLERGHFGNLNPAMLQKLCEILNITM